MLLVVRRLSRRWVRRVGVNLQVVRPSLVRLSLGRLVLVRCRWVRLVVLFLRCGFVLLVCLRILLCLRFDGCGAWGVGGLSLVRCVVRQGVFDNLVGVKLRLIRLERLYRLLVFWVGLGGWLW